MRALVVSNMAADAAHPARGSFVRDQVAALRALPGLEVELFEFAPGPRALAAAAVALARRRGAPFDVVHAHFGLSAYPALAVRARRRVLTLHGTDVHHPRTRLLTRLVAGRMSLLAAASPALAQELEAAGWGSGSARGAGIAVLPVGVDVERFVPLARTQARAELGLDPGRRYLLFGADPARPEKRVDRARSLAAASGTELLVVGAIEPAAMPLYVNAADAVVVPSEREGFGLAVVEALACDVPVLATPVGIHRLALDGVRGALCTPFSLEDWSAFVAQMLSMQDPRVEGRGRAERFSLRRMAARVAEAWAGRDPGALA